VRRPNDDLAGTRSARANARPPRVELLEVCWQFVGPSQRTIECGIYEVATGLEVRAGYSAEDIVRTQLTPDIDTARSIAAGWRPNPDRQGLSQPRLTLGEPMSQLAATIGGEVVLCVLAAVRFLVWRAHHDAHTPEGRAVLVRNQRWLGLTVLVIPYTLICYVVGDLLGGLLR
jgi:hypothetical protein